MTRSLRHIRRRYRAVRATLSPHQRQQAALAFAERMSRQAAFRRAVRIAAYFAHGGELDPAPLLDLALRQGKKVYLPVVQGASMRFARFEPGDRMTLNRFEIPEPAPRRFVRTLDLDLAIVPLMAFDHHGHRVGQGGGYYDRHFSRQLLNSWRRPRLVGAGYDLQRHPRLLTNSWDVPMWRIVTEKAVYKPRA